MRTVKTKTVQKRNVVLAAVLLSVLLAALGSVAFAAPASSTTKSTERGLVFFDPFRIRTILVAAELDDIGVQSAVVSQLRPPIRLPLRPPLRSAFRPIY